jgi:hypothetical protein
MGDVCSKCHRPKGHPADDADSDCPGEIFTSCHIATAAYHRGLRAGVELAKGGAFIDYEVITLLQVSSPLIDWSDVDAALAEKVKV